MASVHLGINNCFAAKRWPEPETWCRIIKEDFGLKIVQFSFDLLAPKTKLEVQQGLAEQVAQALKNNKLALTSTFTGGSIYSLSMLLHPNLGMRLDALEWFEKAIALSGKLGAETTGGHLGAYSCDDYHRSDRKQYLFDFFTEALVHLSVLGKKAGFKFLLWEPMPVLREGPATIKEAKI